MRAWISLIAALCAFGSNPFEAGMARAAEPLSSCGTPSDVHDGWAMSSPDKQGMNPVLLCTMEQGITGGTLANVDSIVIVRNGALVYERYFDYPQLPHVDATVLHKGNSMTKSVVSLLVGIAMDRGQIKDLDAPIASSYFQDDTNLRTPRKDGVTLRHLLTMSAGLGFDRTPGVSFAYNDRETEAIGTILRKATGKNVEELAQQDLFAPLGITDFDWQIEAYSGLPAAARGLELRPRDWAKIGQLVLDHGAWQGQQIVPASWITQSTTSHIKAGPPFVTQIKAGGPDSYGYQWWIGQSPDADRPVQWVAAIGFNSQKILIIPSRDMVVVFNASRHSRDMVAPELDLLDRYILPATAAN